MKGLGEILIELDEFEAMRLCDFENLEQIEAGEKMNVSRGTIQRLLYKGRAKLMEALLSKKALIINLKNNEDSNVNMHSHKRGQRAGRRCK